VPIGARHYLNAANCSVAKQPSKESQFACFMVAKAQAQSQYLADSVVPQQRLFMGSKHERNVSTRQKSLTKWTTERALTNRRLVIKRGLIGRQTEEISFNRIEEVNLNQSMLQRILGSGDIRVTGTGSGEVVMKNIDAPLSVQKKINEVRQYQ
jgi:hypothetical protein